MNNTYVFLGDSLTYGYGVKSKDNWVNLLKNDLNMKIYNKGVNGNTTADMLYRFTEDVINLSANKLFLMAGTNDLISKRSISSIISNIEIMIKEALNSKIEVILGIPPDIISNDANKLFMKCDNYPYCEENLPLLRNELIKLSKKYNLKYIDFYTITNISKKNNSDIYLDGIHLNPNGQKILFQEAKKVFILGNA